MKRIEIDESARSLLQLCVEIGRDKFQSYAATSFEKRVAEQFARQAKEAEALLNVIALADTITVSASDHTDAA